MQENYGATSSNCFAICLNNILDMWKVKKIRNFLKDPIFYRSQMKKLFQAPRSMLEDFGYKTASQHKDQVSFK